MALLAGSTYLRRTQALRNVASSKKCVVVGWLQCDAGEGGNNLVGGAGAQTYLSLDLSTTTGFITLTLTNAAGTDIWGVTTDTAYDDGALYHLAISVDLGNSRTQFYINGDTQASDLTTNTGAADDTIAFATATEWVVGAGLAAAGPFTGYLWDIEFWPGVSIDLSDSDELNQVVAVDDDQGLATFPANVKPVGYGHQGAYLGEYASILTGELLMNRGVGGDFTLTGGSPDEDAYPDGPSAFRLFPRWHTPGERWFLSEQGGEPYPRSQTVIENREGLTSFGKRIGLDEVDQPTRRERPGMNFSDLILGTDTDDDDEDYVR